MRVLASGDVCNEWLGSQEMSDLYVARKVNAITCLQVVITRVISSRNVAVSAWDCRVTVTPRSLHEVRDDTVAMATSLGHVARDLFNIIHYSIPLIINVFTR